jgi:hypothetical protein
MKHKLFSVPLPFQQKVKGKATTSFEMARFSFKDRSVDIFCFPGFSNNNLKETCTEFIKEYDRQNYQNYQNDPFSIKHSNPHVEHALFQLLYKSSESTPKLSALVANHQNLQSQQGLHVKLKINSNRNEFLEILKSLRDYTKSYPQFRFRLDANQQLSIESLQEYFELLKENKLDQNLDYFEEPLLIFEDYSMIDSEIPIGIEENVDSYIKDPSLFSPKAVVIKPSQQGISRIANVNHSNIIISSCFDTKWAFNATKEIALKFPKGHHGLSAVSNDRDLVEKK